MNWRDCVIGDFVDKGLADLKTGPFGNQTKGSDYASSGTPVIGARNIGLGNLLPDKVAYVNEEATERLFPHVLHENDIVFGRKAAFNRHLFVTQQHQGWIQGSDCIRLRFAADDIFPRFVSYAFLSEKHRQWMLSQTGNDAKTASLNQDIIKRIPIRLPPMRVQQQIVAVLSTYDELIQNNRRRVYALEKAAIQMYSEWFVRLRFPGHQHKRIAKGIPEGWDRHSLGSLCRIKRGASPRPISKFMGGDIPWFKISDGTASESCFILKTDQYITADGAKKSVVLPQGTVILSNSGDSAIPYFTAVHGCVHDGWLYFSNLKTISRHLLYCYLYVTRETLVGNNGHELTQKNLTTSLVGSFDIALPGSSSLVEQFDETVRPMFAMIWTLARQNLSLAIARDLLLPRLMSGQLGV